MPVDLDPNQLAELEDPGVNPSLTRLFVARLSLRKEVWESEARAEKIVQELRRAIRRAIDFAQGVDGKEHLNRWNEAAKYVEPLLSRGLVLRVLVEEHHFDQILDALDPKQRFAEYAQEPSEKGDPPTRKRVAEFAKELWNLNYRQTAMLSILLGNFPALRFKPGNPSWPGLTVAEALEAETDAIREAAKRL